MNNLLRLLGDGRFHSGEELGFALGVSRSAVWKSLQRLESECGVRLFKVPGKGYRLAEPLSLLSQADCSVALARFGWRFWLRDTVDSTNAEALRLLQSGITAPFVVLAESQTTYCKDCWAFGDGRLRPLLIQQDPSWVCCCEPMLGPGLARVMSLS